MFSHQPVEGPRLENRTYRVDPDTFMQGLQSVGVNYVSADAGMGGGMGGMGGMGRPGMMFSYARMNLRPQAGMTHVRVGANGVVNPRPKPTLTDWRRALRLHQPLSLKW